MTPKIRLILFIALASLFFITAPSAYFYSQGYRVDFKGRKIVKTGALYFKIAPKAAGVNIKKIDGDSSKALSKKTDAIFGTLYIDNLLPGKYNIDVAKEGFLSWSKALEIRENEATEAKSIILIADDIKFDLLSKDVNAAYLSPDGKRLILERIANDTWSLSLLDVQRNLQTKIAEKNGEFYGLAWSEDSQRCLLETAALERIRFYVWESQRADEELVSLDFLGNDVEKVAFLANEENKVLFLKNSQLHQADYAKGEISPSISSGVFDYKVSGGKIYILNTQGVVSVTDASFKAFNTMNSKLFEIKNETAYELLVFGPNIFISDSTALYFLSDESNEFEKILDAKSRVKISPDRQKAAAFSENEIWVLFLEEKIDQPHKLKNEKMFLTRFSEKINDVSWLSSNYIVFNSGNVIKAAEIDDRDYLQIWDIFEFANPKIFLSSEYKKIFVLSNKNFYFSGEIY